MSANQPNPAGPPEGDSPHWHRYAGLGTEFAASVIGLTLAGLWFDHHYQSYPRGVLVGAALGLTGGTYNFIRAAQRMNAESTRRTARRKQSQDKADDVDPPGA